MNGFTMFYYKKSKYFCHQFLLHMQSVFIVLYTVVNLKASMPSTNCGTGRVTGGNCVAFGPCAAGTDDACRDSRSLYFLFFRSGSLMLVAQCSSNSSVETNNASGFLECVLAPFSVFAIWPYVSAVLCSLVFCLSLVLQSFPCVCVNLCWYA